MNPENENGRLGTPGCLCRPQEGAPKPASPLKGCKSLKCYRENHLG